jgi:mono/diheme cytochrome c family protein
LAGGRAFETAFGTFYSPNITPDEATGIGRWSREQFARALKHGRAPDGRPYFPVFPYTAYRLMTDADAAKLYGYLQQLEPVRQVNRPHALRWWVKRWVMRPWQWWYLDEPCRPVIDPSLARGRYLVDALGHCGECHTARDRFGAVRVGGYLAGNPVGPEDGSVPNITPDRESGIGKWSLDDIAYFLDTGQYPDGDFVGASMTPVVDHSTSKLTAADRESIAAYLKSIPALPGPESAAPP